MKKGQLIVYYDEKNPNKKCVFDLLDGDTYIGSDNSCEVKIDAQGIALKHTKITTTTDTELSVEDLGSELGTYRQKDSKKIKLKPNKEYELDENQPLYIGKFKIVVQLDHHNKALGLLGISGNKSPYDLGGPTLVLPDREYEEQQPQQPILKKPVPMRPTTGMDDLKTQILPTMIDNSNNNFNGNAGGDDTYQPTLILPDNNEILLNPPKPKIPLMSTTLLDNSKTQILPTLLKDDGEVIMEIPGNSNANETKGLIMNKDNKELASVNKGMVGIGGDNDSTNIHKARLTSLANSLGLDSKTPDKDIVNNEKSIAAKTFTKKGTYSFHKVTDDLNHLLGDEENEELNQKKTNIFLDKKMEFGQSPGQIASMNKIFKPKESLRNQNSNDLKGNNEDQKANNNGKKVLANEKSVSDEPKSDVKETLEKKNEEKPIMRLIDIANKRNKKKEPQKNEPGNLDSDQKNANKEDKKKNDEEKVDGKKLELNVNQVETGKKNVEKEPAKPSLNPAKSVNSERNSKEEEEGELKTKKKVELKKGKGKNDDMEETRTMTRGQAAKMQIEEEIKQEDQDKNKPKKKDRKEDIQIEDPKPGKQKEPEKPKESHAKPIVDEEKNLAPLKKKQKLTEVEAKIIELPKLPDSADLKKRGPAELKDSDKKNNKDLDKKNSKDFDKKPSKDLDKNNIKDLDKNSTKGSNTTNLKDLDKKKANGIKSNPPEDKVDSSTKKKNKPDLLPQDNLDNSLNSLIKRNAFQLSFTGFDKTEEFLQMKKDLMKLGIKIIDDYDKPFNILIMSKIFKRTIKFLYAINKGIDILTTKWVEDSIQNNKIITDLNKYQLIDEKSENEYGYKLHRSLKLSRTLKQKFLEGWKVYISDNIIPSYNEMKYLILSANGEIIKVKPTYYNEKTIILCKEDDEKLIKYFVNLGYMVHSTELIFSGCLNQRLNLGKNVISEP